MIAESEFDVELAGVEAVGGTVSYEFGGGVEDTQLCEFGAEVDRSELCDRGDGL